MVYRCITDNSKPLKRRNTYLVPHIKDYISQEYIPVYLPAHNDLKSNQLEIHYHVDFRFIKDTGEFMVARIIINSLTPNKIVYLPKKLYRLTHKNTTDKKIIEKTITKNFCKGKKCVHKGYDLTNEKPKNNIITCPLHGLQYDTNFKLIKL